MKKMLALVAILIFAAAGLCQPQNAVVRIPSHGISGTVICSGQGKSQILSCAHGFGEERPDFNLLKKPITIDVPDPNPQPKQVGVKLIAIDWQWDLSLIEVNTELPYVCPVAPRNAAPSANVHSVGYDSMKTPPQDRPATIIDRGQLTAKTWTREQPRPGRSGGGLIDVDSQTLIGVCHGYIVGNVEGVNSPGVYVSLSVIHIFLDKPTPPPTPDSSIRARPGQPSAPGFRIFEQTPGCPPGGS